MAKIFLIDTAEASLFLDGTLNGDQIEISHLGFAAATLKSRTIYPYPLTISTTGGQIQPTTVINPHVDDPSDAFRFIADVEFELPAQEMTSNDGSELPLNLRWKKMPVKLTVSDPANPATNELRIGFSHLTIASPKLPGIEIECNARLLFVGDAMLLDQSAIHIFQPDENHTVTIDLQDVHFDSNLFGLKWNDPNINFWLKLFSDDLQDTSAAVDVTANLQILTGASPEIRLDWQHANRQRNFKLPGMALATSASGTNAFSLLLQPVGNALNKVTLALSLPQSFSFRSNFAWERDADRELLNDDNRPATAPPVLQLSPTPQNPVTAVLTRFTRGQSNLPKFLQQFESPLPAIDFANPTPSPTTVRSFKAADWQPNLNIQLNSADFKFPFLRIGSGSNTFDQFVNIDSVDPVSESDYSFTNHAVSVNVNLSQKVGALAFQNDWGIAFNWETFAFAIDHNSGIDLLGDVPELPAMQHMNLMWRFKGVPYGSSGKFHYFKLVTKGYNYQIKLAPGASVELDFTKASVEPITFRSTSYTVTAKGISLIADVLDNPARLNGINTRYRFHSTQMQIVDNRILDFTLSGTGPLPPDLVGDAMADIALQFKQNTSGNLLLVAGAAQLKDTDQLDAKNIRFQYAVDSLGLDFVDDGKYHLYFKISGNAKYVPTPIDDPNGPLALLSAITIKLVECPLTGDASVIARHIGFLIEFPEPLTFSFLGCFTFELRAIGFLAYTEKFGGEASIQLTGQVMFAKGGQDTHSAKLDFHGLYIGIPKKGSVFPRISLEKLAVEIIYGEAFKLTGMVSFVDNELQKGFLGEGQLEMKGMPVIAAAFGFMRARLDENSNWLRAWFIYLEVRKVSFMIPRLEIYLREIGLGFGYRYTITSIKQADDENDIGKLVRALRDSSRTAGDLAKVENWALDLEKRGEDPRWTIVFRAMFSQSSASPSPLKYNEGAEKFLPCAYLFDAIVAFRSDLTFFMAVRGWINTNYNDFFENTDDLRTHPIVSGFVLLAPRKKRFLAHVSSNPDGSLGARPALPEFARKAILKSDFSATMLIEPGLFHFELGWPNMLRFRQLFGPVIFEVRAGFIFRISETEMVIGVSMEARATLDIEAGFEAVVIGASISAHAIAAVGARLVGMTSLVKEDDFAVYGAIGIEMRIEFRLIIWIGLKIGFVKITKEFKLSFTLGFTAGIEIGLTGPDPGVRGTGTIYAKFMGHGMKFTAKFKSNEGAVIAALGKVQPFLNTGLTSEDVEGTPGIDPATQNVSAKLAPQSAAMRVGPQPSAALRIGGNGAARPSQPGVAVSSLTGKMVEFHAPDYNLLVINKPAADGKTFAYFLLLPKGEDEQGFLPVPPNDTIEVSNDFSMTIPDSGKTFVLQRFNADSGDLETVDDLANVNWKVNWDAVILSAENYGEGTPDDTDPVTETVKLADYLLGAFVLDADNQPIGDPELLAAAKTVIDERVQNPTDNAFEAAVRGAVEQFKGSPYFKKDYQNEYEQALQNAFDDGKTIYSADGTITPESQAVEQADHLRSMVIHDLISDFREFVDAISETGEIDAEITGSSIAFQMGIVFRMECDDVNRPEWLDFSRNYLENHSLPYPKIRQRFQPDSPSPDGSPEKSATTFNIAAANFANFSPQFQNLRHYTSANTIAIAWELTWENLPEDGCTTCQADPEHHLLHYIVRRRALDGSEPEQVYTVKNAEALQLETDANGNPLLSSLRPRFQVVDHFNHETPEDQANLPAGGRSYLYSITPADVAGNLGRPLSLVATRYPSEPPLVPNNGELTVSYRIADALLSPDEVLQNSGDVITPVAITPHSLRVSWREPGARDDRPMVPVKTYRLIFRKDDTMPVGSYGLDASTRGPKSKSLPTSNARPLPTDIKIELDARGSREARFAEIPVTDLRDAGIFPAGDEPKWQPEAWNIYFQTVSVNDVPSALAPVNLLLRVESDDPAAQKEERRPEQLEWLPKPVQFPLLPPEDQRAIPGLAHFPMPTPGSFAFAGSTGADILNRVQFTQHPDELRCIRFRWNQGPGDQPDYPLPLNAGYHLLELNIDAHTDATFDDKERLAKAIRKIQEVQMLPADELLLAPSDTLTASQWESWYPTTLQRLRDPANRLRGSETPFGPWFSWRDSYLVWPEWPGFTNVNGDRNDTIHPALRKLVNVLKNDPEGRLPATYIVDLQISPPVQENNFDDLIAITDPGPDPYGWGILQRFGLCASISLRNKSTGDLITGAALLEAINKAYLAYRNDPVTDGQNNTLASFDTFLHVELLFQPSSAVSLETGGNPKENSLLGIVQINLRPAIRQDAQYAKVPISGDAKTTVTLLFSEIPADGCVLVNQSELAKGEIEIKPPATGNALKYVLTLPLNGATTLLLRSRTTLPKIEKELQSGTVELPKTGFDPTDELASYFTVPVDALAVDFAQNPASNALAKQWQLFKFYAESLNSNQTDPPPAKKIEIPTAEPAIKSMLPDYLSWTNRFFEHGGEMDLSPQTVKKATKNGPWLATAYPQSGNPVYASPDESGRLKYDHLLEDRYAHNLRYYIRPYGRYDLLWQSLRQSPALFPDPRIDELLIDLRDARVSDLLIKTFENNGLSLLKTATISQQNRHEWTIASNGSIYTVAQETDDLQVFESETLKFRLEKNFKLLPEATPEPQDGALDVVLDRTKPVAMPVILRSGRLDENPVPGKPAAPGKHWEVIVAQHPEQALIERNQTLFRQLAFRQIAFTLLRRFAFADWPETLANLAQIDPIGIQFVQNQFPEIPASYPDQPDHIPMITGQIAAKLANSEIDDALRMVFEQHNLFLSDSATVTTGDPDEWQISDGQQQFVIRKTHRVLTVLADETELFSFADAIIDDAETARSLDLPRRIGNFQQGAMVLQWQSLPYFYEHRLLLIAQTATTVSPVNETVQQDFEYRSPDPVALSEGMELPGGSIRFRQIDLLLNNFWDALKADAQSRWHFEQPESAGFTIGKTFAEELDNLLISNALRNEFSAANFELPQDAQVLQTIAGERWEIQDAQFELLFVIRREGNTLHVFNNLTNRRKLASLPDPETVYQIVESFSGNIEVQTELLYDAENNRFIRRQLGENFVAGDPNLVAPDGDNPLGDFLLRFPLRQFTRAELSKTYAIPPGFPHLSFENNTLIVDGVFTAADRDMLLSQMQIANGEKFVTLTQGPALGSLSPDVLAKLRYPELPEARNLPTNLQQHIEIDTIRDADNATLAMRWRGAMLPEQKSALQNYRTDLPVFQNAVTALLAKLSSQNIEFTAPYTPPTERPHPDTLIVPGKFAMAVTYPPDPNPKWTLGWNGAISTAQESTLRSLSGDADFKNGINGLITAIKNIAFQTAVNFGLTLTSTIPNFSIQLQPNFQRALRWSNPNPEQEAAIRALEVGNDPAFRAGVDNLVAQLNNHYNNINFTRDISYVEPPRPLPGANGLPPKLAILVISPPDPDARWELNWTGTLNAAEENALRALDGDNPFRQAISALIDAIKADPNITPSTVTTQIISGVFVQPVIDLGNLGAEIKYDLSNLVIDKPAQLLRWKGADTLQIPPQDLIDRMNACLPANDNFRIAFVNLMSQIAADGFAQNFALPRQLAIRAPLSQPQLTELLTKFPNPVDQQKLRTLLSDFQDREVILNLFESWNSRTAITAPVVSVPPPVAALIDFPEPVDCPMIWAGEMSTAERDALLALPGDDAFKTALQRLSDAAATATDGDVTTASAPLGLDQLPKIIADGGKLAFTTETGSDGQQYTALTWTGEMNDTEAETLRKWAQLPQFLTAVIDLINQLENKEISKTISPEIPAAVIGKLQINPGEVAWIGAAPNADELAALQEIVGDVARDVAFRNAVAQLITNAGEDCAATVAVPGLIDRPKQADLPEILREQLTIADTSIQWHGRIANVEQLAALQSLTGDTPFNSVIAEILSEIGGSVTVNFTLPVRPDVADLAPLLADKLLIGKAQIRYHGLMTLTEGRALQDAFSRQSDKAAVQRLYDTSQQKGLQGRELLLRARRGSAAPGDTVPLMAMLL